MNYKQTSFLGGLNRQFDATKLAEDEYPLLVNGRVRNDQVETIQLPQEITTGIPEGNNFQGLYSAGFFLLAFIDGKAYYRSFDPANPQESFTPIVGFSLDPNVDRIYCELVSGSTINFKRQANTTNVASDGVQLTNKITGSPDCALVTDGINQARVIFPDATSRVTQTWQQWTESETGELREYVPIGTYPLFLNGVLYLAMLDIQSKRLNRIGRSVTGRPLDFMVIVDSNGNKLDNELNGGADVVALKCDYNTITALSRISLIQNPQTSANASPPIFVSTAYNSYLMSPDIQNLIYGEPKFNYQFLFQTGALNPFCIIDEISGDTLIIDAKGIISFNATSYAKAEGRNLPFSRKIHPLFKDITQTVACCTKLDNYIYFGVNTVYGPAIVVYDEITQKWVSVDIYPNVNLIKQFAIISTTTVKRVFFITIDNKLYEAFASSQTATCRLYAGEWMEEKINQRVLSTQTAFKDILTEGQIHCTLFVDGLKHKRNIQPIEPNQQSSTVPIDLPFGRSDQNSVQNLTFGFPDAPTGYKHGLLLEWNCKATLSSLDLTTSENNPTVNPQQDSIIERDKTNLNNSLGICLAGWLGQSSAEVAQLVTQIKEKNPSQVVLLGNQNLPVGALDTLQNNVKQYWDKLKQAGKVTAVLGPKDLDTLNGQAQLEYFLQGRYFSQVLTSEIELFVLNSGYNSAGNLVEPDGVAIDSNQYRWFKTSIANSARKWKIVLLWDTPIYSTSGFQNWDFKRLGASIVIGAKNKNYERLFQDQLVSLNVGTGNTLEPIAEPFYDESKYRYHSTKGFLFLDIDSINLNGMFYALGNSKQPIDTFQILG